MLQLFLWALRLAGWQICSCVDHYQPQRDSIYLSRGERLVKASDCSCVLNAQKLEFPARGDCSRCLDLTGFSKAAAGCPVPVCVSFVMGQRGWPVPGRLFGSAAGTGCGGSAAKRWSILWENSIFGKIAFFPLSVAHEILHTGAKGLLCSLCKWEKKQSNRASLNEILT